MYNIWIWGTGKYAQDFLHYYFPVMQEIIKIEGIIDNNRCEGFFMGYPIYKPNCFFSKVVDYDYIVIMNTHYKEIISQLKCENQSTEKVLHIDGLILLFNETNYWKSKKVAFVGDELCHKWFKYHARFLIGESTFLEEHELKCDDVYDYYFVCPPRLISENERTEFEDRIIYSLSPKVNENKILRFDAWKLYFQGDICLKRSREGTKYLIIAVSDPIQGWGNILYRFMASVTYAMNNGFLPVIDMKNCESQYIKNEDIGKRNVWEDFFYQPTQYSLDEAYGGETVYITGINTHMDVTIGDFIPRMKESLYREFIQERERLFGSHRRILGIIYRGTDYYRASDHPVPMEMEKFVSLVREKCSTGKYEHIFLATEVQSVTDIMRNEFGDKLSYTNQERYDENERRLLSNVHFDRENDEFLRAKEYLIVLFLLAECDGLIGQDTGTMSAAIVLSHKSNRDIQIL